MLTDEQVKTVANILDVPLSTTLMRKALEAYEQNKWVKFDVNDKSTHPKIPDNDVCVTILGVTDLRENSGEVVYVEYYGALEDHVYDPNKHCCNTPFILFDRGCVGEVDYGIVEVSAVHLIAWQPLPTFKE
jgi:hypothetical protein